jgi:predicted nucleic acid-binding protein
MPVVSDADVLIHLAKLTKLPLLRTLYKSVSIPAYVRQEIISKHDIGISEAVGSYLIIHHTSDEKAESIAAHHGIHLGEAHVKVLGEKLGASVFLSNERKVRKAAAEEGFHVAGTIGVILRAAHVEIITKPEAVALLELMKAEDFRIHPDLLQEAISTVR